ncbi:hypothetical protein CJ030_MR2G016676 [Morella rubra]|uniref:Uncharacterized protein n=1 Tax=Morella rubra TaxID=262757 RepID=A0A6A1WEN2_9ROSI|nr:hypothetical protein CJ030_MR2G016676 [Morella rubra]
MLGVDPLVEVVSVESPSDLGGVGKGELGVDPLVEIVSVESPSDLGGVGKGYEKDLMSLFAALERDREQSSLVTPRRNNGKLARELKCLESSINYNGKSASSKG